MINQSTKINVSRHARERVVERFDHLLPSYGSMRELEQVIADMVREGEHLEDWKRVPFYYNAICAKNQGTDTEFVSYKGEFIFICRYFKETDTLIVVTTVLNMLYYPKKGSFAIPTQGGAKFINTERYIARLEEDAYAEYKEKYGTTPKGVWVKTPAYLEEQKNRGLRNSYLSTIEKYDRTLKGCYSMGTAEQIHINKIELLKKLNNFTVQDEINMYTHLLKIADYQINHVGNPNAMKNWNRYKEKLQQLTG